MVLNYGLVPAQFADASVSLFSQGRVVHLRRTSCRASRSAVNGRVSYLNVAPKASLTPRAPNHGRFDAENFDGFQSHFDGFQSRGAPALRHAGEEMAPNAALGLLATAR